MADQFCAECGARLEPKARFCAACGTKVGEAAPAPAPRRTQKRPRAQRTSRALPWPLIIAVAGIALLAVALLFRNGAPGATQAPDQPVSAGLPFPNVPRITVEETRARFDSGTAVIVDVRDAEQYAAGHIPNAISMPLGEVPTRYQELSPDAEILTYCT